MNHYYVCGNYTNKGPTACKANAIPASPVEVETLSRFQNMVTNNRLLSEIVTRINRSSREAEAPLREQLAQNIVKLKQLEKQQRRCYELFEGEHIGHVELVEKLESLLVTKYNLIIFQVVYSFIQSPIPKCLGRTTGR